MSVATLSVSMEQRRDVSRHQRARTSRCLFDRPNMEELQRKYEEQSREEMRRFKEEWGFDPERDCPVVGHVRFQWEPMQPDTKEQPQTAGSNQQEVAADPSPSPEEQPSQSPKFNTTRPLKQSSMKDYFAERKRFGEASSAVGKKRRQSEGSSSDEATSSSSSSSNSSQQVN
ncbi:Hypothetical predicted protein [Cloeon dipterum]|uniref:Cyclin-dependent kinase inhibitor domain-containing protein n=1 Tax=Cloeon dipterum TaxID=197152 RepID=A0A8S1CIM7_9INSE|nr:Hypothetical predicted protein [Cloeon dipterum]